MTEQPRLIFHSNAPWGGTGYATQTALFALKLKEDFNLSISAFWGLEGAIIPWNGIPILPGINATYGDSTIKEHVQTVLSEPRNGLVMTLMDVWVLDPRVWAQFNTCCWTPVDHEPTPDPIIQFFQSSGSIPIAMSRFGEQQLSDLNPLYCPHGVDTTTYTPLDQAESREAMGMEQDVFCVGMVAANKGNSPSRKSFQEAFQAFAAFHRKHPDTMLYLHSEATGRFDGVKLPQLLEACGVPPEAVRYCDQYRATHFPFDDETMARAYSSMDVYLSPSAGEGFGVGAIQAQACGVPVICSDFSAQPELVGAGWLVKGTKFWTPIGSWQFRPDVPDIIEALDASYRSRGRYAEKAREKALEYDAEKVYREHMLPALAEVQRRFDARKPVELAA